MGDGGHNGAGHNGSGSGNGNGADRKAQGPQLSVHEALSGARLLVTGATGFVGKVWLCMLLDRVPAAGPITLIIRARRGQSPADRFWRLIERSPAFRPLRKKYGPELRRRVGSRVRVVAGDVAEPLCGLDPDAARRLASECDAVVHVAGLTDFEPDPRSAIETNVKGASHAADLAALCPTPRFLHVSTTFVAGTISGRVPETITPGVAPTGATFDAADELEALIEACKGGYTAKARIAVANERAANLGWPNIYTYTKGLSEHLVAGRDDVQATLVRPSVVESATKYPFAGWNEGINTSGPLVWLLSSWFRSFPSQPDHRFDVVPVDTVARTMLVVLAEMLRGEARPVYQVGSSATNPLTFDRAIDLTALAARRMHARPGASTFDRLVTQYLDAVPRHADEEPFPSLGLLRSVAQRARGALKDFSPKEVLPPIVYRRVGTKLDERVRSLSMKLRQADRTMGQIEEMLRLYRPFIHDHDYVFATDEIERASARLVPAERDAFRFDVDEICWRTYWLDIHVPGLEKWSLPLLRGERVPDDPAPKLAPALSRDAMPQCQEARLGGNAP